ncbi:MAG: glycosyl hydrolase [Acidimicrobiaceae bacterium]|nr:glycosyl hydrolase [Acidimicrobiaceae bacterium]
MDVDRLLSELTVEEKAALVSGADMWHTVAVDRLGIPAIMCSDGPHGMRAQVGDVEAGEMLGAAPATCFPTASAIASSWDRDLIREVGVAIADEARHYRVSVVLGPGVNMKRSPLCGRNFEYVSEDPYLAGELGLAMVEGIQSRDVGTSVKHYAANNQEHDRLRVSAEIDERTLREIYLPAFERIVTAAQPWTVMCAYNRVNGTHASQHEWLLTDVLRDEWGFDGVVVSDWGAVHDRVAAVQAGLDWEMPPDLERSPPAVVAAVERGWLDEAVLDRSVRRMLEMVAKGRHVLDLDEDVDVDAHHELARRTAAESAVLLKNDGELLPLTGDGSLAVIGEFARTPRFQGSGSSRVTTTKVDVALDEITSTFGADRVTFAAGYVIEGETDSDDVDADTLRTEAVRAAASADTVVFFMGLPDSWESEGFDREHMDLPPHQLDTLAAVRAVNDRVVVVMVNGATVIVEPWCDLIPAILECWLGGQAAGGAIADLLSGDVSPGGRLAETMPVRLNDVPSTLNFPGDPGVVRYGEGVFIGYRAHDHLDQRVSFPFGFGLSYTTFDITDLDVALSGAAADGTLTAAVSATVTNTGGRRGSHVVQVYVGDDEAEVARPPRELKGFAKVHLDPGASERVTVELDQRAFSFWSPRHRRWVVEAGSFTISVGSHSRDLPLSATVDVDAPSVRPPLDAMATLTEWADDPAGWAVLDAFLPERHPARSKRFRSLLGSMPIDTLAGFGSFGFTHADVDTLLERVREHHPTAP